MVCFYFFWVSKLFTKEYRARISNQDPGVSVSLGFYHLPPLQAEILWTFNIIQYQSPCVITQRTAVFSILSMFSKKLFLITFLKFTSILKFVVLMAKLLTWGKKQISWAWREKGRQLQFRDKFSARKKNHAMNYMLWKITKIKTKRNSFSRADFRKYLVFYIGH